MFLGETQRGTEYESAAQITPDVLSCAIYTSTLISSLTHCASLPTLFVPPILSLLAFCLS